MTRRRQTLEMQAIDTSTGQGAKLPQGPDRDGEVKPPAGPGGAAVLILLLLFTTNQWARQLIFYTVDFKATPSAEAAFQFMNVDLGFNEAQYGILASIGFAALFSLTSLVAGGLVDRTDTRNLLTSTSVLWTGATVLTGAAGSFNEVLAARMVSGVGQAFANPAAYAILRRLYPPERLASVNGLYASGLYFGGGLAALSVLLDASLGWRQLCVIVGMLGLASAAAVQLTLPRGINYDGITSRYSAWAAGVSDAVIQWRACWVGPLTHSIFVTDSYNQITQAKPSWDWQTALTWNADALARVNRAIDESDTALQQPNRQGC